MMSFQEKIAVMGHIVLVAGEVDAGYMCFFCAGKCLALFYNTIESLFKI
jgi:hypothetical protein